MSRYIDPMSWIVIVLVLVLAVNVRRVIPGPVSRERLERFARRQALVLTPGNSGLVTEYLATTRRWRATGLAAGILLTVAWSLRDNRVTINAMIAFASWFVGALVAEFRVASLEPGARRAASLEPRLLRRQLVTSARILPVYLFGLAVACAVASLLAIAAGREVQVPLLLGQVGLAVLALGLPALV